MNSKLISFLLAYSKAFEFSDGFTSTNYSDKWRQAEDSLRTCSSLGEEFANNNWSHLKQKQFIVSPGNNFEGSYYEQQGLLTNNDDAFYSIYHLIAADELP